MAVKYGFYDAINKDRVYSAIDMSSIFEGVICDGVFRHVGKAFALGSRDGLTITIKSGRAWLAHTYFVNQNDFSITLPNNSTVLVGIEVNRGSRLDALKYVTVADTSVVNPPGYNTKPDSPNRSESLYINESYKYFYPLYRMVTQNNAVSSVQDLRGTSACPWARNTDQGSLEAALAQANARYDEIADQLSNANITTLGNRVSALETFKNTAQSSLTTLTNWMNSAKTDIQTLLRRTNQNGVMFMPWRNWYPYYVDVNGDKMHVFVSGIYMADENGHNGLYTMSDANDANDDKRIYMLEGIGFDGRSFSDQVPGVTYHGSIYRERSDGTWYGGEITPSTAGLTISFHYMNWMGYISKVGLATLSGGVRRSSNM